ncbi:hypothetical protein IGK67_000797 [Enterococcus sp. AZ093]|uniref:YopX family protein n=1 Tax=Enterococcus sp. AZ093 TaxID=2774859 RepID=UPI003F1F62C7
MMPKFRAWLKDEQEMQDVLAFDTRGHSFLGIEGAHVTVDGWCDVFGVGKQAELMQSTGLKDKNGVEIFEGDIVKKTNESIGYVVYLQQEAGFVVVLKKSDYRLGHRNTGEPYKEATNHEVIGNIYENSELLKQ